MALGPEVYPKFSQIGRPVKDSVFHSCVFLKLEREKHWELSSLRLMHAGFILDRQPKLSPCSLCFWCGMFSQPALWSHLESVSNNIHSNILSMDPPTCDKELFYISIPSPSSWSTLFSVSSIMCLFSFPLFWNSVAAKVWWTRRQGILLDTFHIAISFSSTRRINLLCPSLLSPALVQCLHPHEGVLSSFRDTVSFSQTLSSILLQSFKVTIASHWI